MNLRAGSYNAQRPVWRGVIRNEGWAWYVCTHNTHDRPSDARACAQTALPALRVRDHQDPTAPMPEGWVVAHNHSG